MPSSPPITLALARFDDLLEGGLRELIGRDPSLTILASGVEQRRMGVILRAHHPDVAILDGGALTRMAEIRELRRRHPGTRLVLLSRDLASAECAQMLAFGASACLRTDTESRDVLNAVHLAARGLQVTAQAASGADGTPTAAAYVLTAREAEVLPMLQGGRSNAQIAAALQVGIETVRTHARNIYRKLGVSSRRELAAPAAAAPRALEPGSPHTRPLAAQVLPPRRAHRLRHDERRS
jgi:DNA-binding NarL/FixJ family response regulator